MLAFHSLIPRFFAEYETVVLVHTHEQLSQRALPRYQKSLQTCHCLSPFNIVVRKVRMLSDIDQAFLVSSPFHYVLQFVQDQKWNFLPEQDSLPQ